MRVVVIVFLIGGLAACDKAPATGAASDLTMAPATPASDGAVPAKDSVESKSDSPVGMHGGARTTWREITIPVGTTLPVILDTTVASDTSRVEQRVEAHVARPVMIDGVAAIPVDSTVTGVVTDAKAAGKVKGRSHLAFRFDTLAPLGQDERYDLDAATVGRTGASEQKKDAAKIAVPAAGGAIIGGIVGGKKGAMIGGAVGGGAGTAVVLTDRGNEVRMRRGDAVSLKLTAPLTLRVRG
jgi:hypothetical protein